MKPQDPFNEDGWLVVLRNMQGFARLPNVRGRARAACSQGASREALNGRVAEMIQSIEELRAAGMNAHLRLQASETSRSCGSSVAR